jgi:pimeloyl-ACP methyl ester carboxylesterase
MQSSIEIGTGITMAYRLDDFTDPWRNAETIILLHGIAETGEAWRGWVPHLARNYRVIRPDLRGFGDSTAMPLSYQWSIAALADDLDAFVTALGLERVHLVGAKLGGLVSMKFAATRPAKVRSLIVSGATVKLDFLAPSIPSKVERMQQEGLRSWAQSTMGQRMGSGLPPEAVAWWVDFMGSARKDTVLGIYRMLASVDITADLPRITAPTLVMTSTNSGYYGSVEAFGDWRKNIRNSELALIEGDSYHISASYPDACAEKAAEFLARQRS